MDREPAATTPAVILYFGGNAEDVLHTATEASNIERPQLWSSTTRLRRERRRAAGRRRSTTSGFALYDYAIGRGTTREHIVVMGRSLGSGVASMLAATRPVRAAILVTPFDSLAAVAAGTIPFYLCDCSCGIRSHRQTGRSGRVLRRCSCSRARQRRPSGHTRRNYSRHGQERSKCTCCRRPGTTISTCTRTTIDSSTSFWLPVMR